LVGVPFGSRGDGVGPPGTGVNSAVDEEAVRDGAGETDDAAVDGCAEVATGVGARPSPTHADARMLAARRQPRRQTFLEGRGSGRVTGSS
jgi:hypothetical protein